MTEVGIDNFNQVFLNYQRALGNLQVSTIGNSFSQLFDKLAGLFADTTGIQNITNQLEVASKLKTNADEREILERRLNDLADRSLATDSKKLQLRRELAERIQEFAALEQQQFNIAEFLDAAYKKAAITTLPAVTKELDYQVSIATKLRQEQDVLNSLRQIELKFLQQGVQLNEQDRQAMTAKLTLAQAASQLQPIRESLSHRPKPKVSSSPSASRP